MTPWTRNLPVVVALLAGVLDPALGDIISDITASSQDEGRALRIKAEQFWEPVLRAAEGAKTEEHMQLYVEAEEVLKTLPSENEYVRTALTEAVDALRRADAMVIAQAVEACQVASERLASPAARESVLSFLSEGRGLFGMAIRRFVDGGEYPERLSEQIRDRQADILPALRTAASSAGNILGDCREASRRSFDALKYDIYNRGSPKTPEAAKGIANRIVEAAGETRRHFLGQTVAAANSLAKDAQGKREDASATVSRSVLDGLAPFGQGETPEKPLVLM
eukprot:CAMPEP_0170599052 /NCGR_PEP_ID=MMETSP0224-20130122/16580_1 /TAXON_ID=285029 /ORGANISM="Togula jolla, Strain CCCM 725" /LENGTH=279 /DNA_ID=CAMNT_0010923655 /DNA_START=247 /DNA_END=1086 /DNA_ORIENTATION=-